MSGATIDGGKPPFLMRRDGKTIVFLCFLRETRQDTGKRVLKSPEIVYTNFAESCGEI